MTASPPAASDRGASKAWLAALEMTATIDAQPQRIFPRVIDELGEKFASAPALFGPDGNLIHSELASRARQVARWAKAQGLSAGQVVALLMPNRADYLAIWLGITRMGGVVALININLTGAALEHCLKVAGPRHIIATENLAQSLAGMELSAPVWRYDTDFAPAVAGQSSAPLAGEEEREVTLADPALLIYTSGTTGLPKAAYVSHHRIMMWTHWFAGMMQAGSSDRLYNCLPMYHSVGGVVASGAVLLKGGAVILRLARRADSGRVGPGSKRGLSRSGRGRTPCIRPSSDSGRVRADRLCARGHETGESGDGDRDR